MRRIWHRSYVTLLSWGMVWALLSSGPSAVAASPKKHMLSLSGALNGGYSSNVFHNASQERDWFGAGAFSLSGKVLPTAAFVFKYLYLGQLEWFGSSAELRQTDHALKTTFGFRPSGSLYLFADLGGESALHFDQKEYTFWGGFGKAGLRAEVGELHTLTFSYQLRSDQFPSYDLDNISHLLSASWAVEIGEDIELSIPLALEIVSYREREVLDDSGNPTGVARRSFVGSFEPRLVYYPSLSFKLQVHFAGEIVNSNDTYYYEGPFGEADPQFNPELIRHFDSYLSLGGGVRATWDLHARLTLQGSIRGGYRHYSQRDAFDAAGEPLDEKQRDGWCAPAFTMFLNLHANVKLFVAYHYFKQWSNDALWHYDVHHVNGGLKLLWNN